MNSDDQSIQYESLDEELVAYLDGELAPEKAASIELRLASDANVRARLQALQRAWDMLDELPQEEIQEEFTQTTIAMVVASAESVTTQAKQSASWRATKIWGLTAVVCAMASFASYQVVDGILNAPNERLKKDLQVIDNMDAYRSAESVEFLRRLSAEGLFEVQTSPIETPDDSR